MIRQEGSFGGVNEFFIKSVIKSQFLRIRYRKAIHLHKERKLIIMSEEKKIPLQPGVNMKEQDIRLQPSVNLKDKEKRIPFDVSIDPLYAGIQTIDTMTVHELNAKLEHSYGQALKGKGKPCDEVFDDLERKFK